LFVPEQLPEPLIELIDGVAGLAAGDFLAATSAEERAAWLVGLRTLIDSAEAVFTQALAGFDAHGDGQTLHAAATTASWLRGGLRLAPGDASQRVQIARGSRNLLAEPVTALATGAISYDQLRAIEHTTRQLPEDQQQPAVTLLTDLAKQADVVAVRTAGQRLQFILNPDGALTQANKQFQRRQLTLSPLLDGMTHLDGLLDPEAATTLTTALAPFLIPAGPHDQRHTAQRRADGLVELARISADHTLLPLVAGQRPHLEILCPLQTLTPTSASSSDRGDSADQADKADSPAHPGPARLPDHPGSGGYLTTQAVHRIACDADIGRVLLGPDSIPTDIGYRHRLFTHHQRRALALRDGGCRFPDCHRPPAHTDAHHIKSWLNGGPTNLDNALLLCRHHHRQTHEGGWTIHTNQTNGTGGNSDTGGIGGNGRVWFTGPNGQRLPSDPARL